MQTTYLINAPRTLNQVSAEHIIMQLPPELEDECNGRIVAMSESAQAYYITEDHIYKLSARDSSNTRFLIALPHEVSETPEVQQVYNVMCSFGSIVELDPCSPILDTVLKCCVAQKPSCSIVTPIYLSRLLSESKFIATKKDVCTYLASLSMLPCNVGANPEHDLFPDRQEYPLARFHTGKVAEVLSIFIEGNSSNHERDDSLWYTSSASLVTLIEIIQRVLPEISWGISAHIVLSLSRAIDGHILSLEKLGEFVFDPTSLKLGPRTMVSLSPRRILASIVLTFITQLGSHIDKAGIPVIEFAFKSIYSKITDMSLPREFLMNYIEEAGLREQQIEQDISEMFSLPIRAYIDLLTPRSLRDSKSVDTSACWIAPESSLLMESQMIYLNRSHLSSSPLNRAFELFDIQSRWRKSAFSALMTDVCSPQESSNIVTECYAREVGRTDCEEIIIIEKREKRILLESRIQFFR